MSSADDDTLWLVKLKQGDHTAAEKIWHRYFERLVSLADHRLGGVPRGDADAEDVAISAFASFCRGGALGRFPRLDDRDDLWQVLIMLTARKAWRRRRDQGRQKRGGGKVRTETDLAGDSEEPLLGQVIGREPTPEFAAMVAQECERLLAGLGDAELRSIAHWKMEGYSNAEIAARVGRTERTVERRLERIRKTWSREDAP